MQTFHQIFLHYKYRHLIQNPKGHQLVQAMLQVNRNKIYYALNFQDILKIVRLLMLPTASQEILFQQDYYLTIRIGFHQ
jgi:hypothetical protein